MTHSDKGRKLLLYIAARGDAGLDERVPFKKMNSPAASNGVSKIQRIGESHAQQAAGNMTPRNSHSRRDEFWVADAQSKCVNNLLTIIFECNRKRVRLRKTRL